MKRSDLIKKIKIDTDNFLSHPIEAHEIGWILDICERAGMKPPKRKVSGVVGPLGGNVYRNRWEPEDETKRSSEID